MNMNFPIDNDLIRPMIQITVEELISIFKQMNEDKGNNSSDDTSTTGLIHQANKGDNGD